MMLVKMIGGTINISNMPDEEAIAKGYKTAVFASKPIAAEGYHAESAWAETENSYVQSWTIVEDVPDDSCDSDEAINILLGGAS